MNVVLDACATIAYLRGEPGWNVVARLLADADTYAHAVNPCEVYYDTIRAGAGTDTARAAASDVIRDLGRVGVVTSADMDTAFWKDVGCTKQRTASRSRTRSL